MRTFDLTKGYIQNNYGVLNDEAVTPIATFVWESEARTFASDHSRRWKSVVEVVRIEQNKPQESKVVYSCGELLKWQ